MRFKITAIDLLGSDGLSNLLDGNKTPVRGKSRTEGTCDDSST